MTHDTCQRKLTSLPQITLSARPVWLLPPTENFVTFLGAKHHTGDCSANTNHEPQYLNFESKNDWVYCRNAENTEMFWEQMACVYWAREQGANFGAFETIFRDRNSIMRNVCLLTINCLGGLLSTPRVYCATYQLDACCSSHSGGKYSFVIQQASWKSA